MSLYKIYKNLTNGKWSIKDHSSGLVVGHADGVILKDCKFIVNESGRQRVLRERQKNVHAYILGSVTEVKGFKSFKGRDINPVDPPSYIPWITHEVGYNPYKYKSFVDSWTFNSVYQSKYVICCERGRVYYQE